MVKSIDCFNKCIELSNRYDDPNLKLWTGYALFNKARSINELIKKVSGDEKEQFKNDWKIEMQKAISVRKKWKKFSVDFPDIIKDGLTTEYFHAVAERLLRAERDNTGKIIEKGRASITDGWEIDEKRAFNEWWDNPRGLRVRLAFNVKENWNKILKKILTKSSSGR